jgi:hypothetical protein
MRIKKPKVRRGKLAESAEGEGALVKYTERARRRKRLAVILGSVLCDVRISSDTASVILSGAFPREDLI